MSTKKKIRALRFLDLLPTHTVAEIAKELGKPLSTIQKHDNAFKRLTGLLGNELYEDSLSALDAWDTGREQVRSTNDNTDHKMVSDLLAMRWAISKKLEKIEAKEAHQDDLDYISNKLKSLIDIDFATFEATVRAEFKTPIDDVSEALDEVLNTLGDLPTEATEALNSLTECVITLEELTTRF